MRDELLGKTVTDRDYVVVGTTPDAMRAAGFKPVGKHFPVFINPENGEEYALARTEKKSGRGYHGFVFHAAPTVTLTEDLCRRDLTINTLAKDKNGNIIDFCQGGKDIDDKILRHVSLAFVEDPVRVLRVARFSAQFPDFSVADETMSLMQEMTNNGEMQYLQSERVWRELSRGLTAAKPSRMLQTLADCGALAVILPEVAALQNIPERPDYHPEKESFLHTKMVIDTAAARGGSVAECFAALLHDIGKALTPAEILPSHHGHEKKSARLAKAVCARLKVPRHVTQLAILAAAEHGNAHKALELRATTLADFFTRTDAYRRPERFESFLRVCEADFYYLPERRNDIYPQGNFIRQALNAAAAVPTKTIAESASNEPEKIADTIRRTRIKAIKSINV